MELLQQIGALIALLLLAGAVYQQYREQEQKSKEKERLFK